MKRIFSIVCLVLVAFVMNAQNNDFEKSWYIQLQGGAAHTVGETQFMNLISPAAAVSVGYQFAPALGARLNLAGFQGKGTVLGIGAVLEPGDQRRTGMGMSIADQNAICGKGNAGLQRVHKFRVQDAKVKAEHHKILAQGQGLYINRRMDGFAFGLAEAVAFLKNGLLGRDVDLG